MWVITEEGKNQLVHQHALATKHGVMGKVCRLVSSLSKDDRYIFFLLEDGNPRTVDEIYEAFGNRGFPDGDWVTVNYVLRSLGNLRAAGLICYMRSDGKETRFGRIYF